MLLTIGVTGTDHRSDGEPNPPATDLGYVLHKHPDRVRSVSTVHGTAVAFWPQASAEAAAVTVLVEVDAVGLTTGRRAGGGTGSGRGRPLAPYINDRPYVASSFLSVAIGKLFRSAMNGDCRTRPELVDHRWNAEVTIPTMAVSGDPGLVRRLFEPLGYEVELSVPPLDEAFPDWGSSPVGQVKLTAQATMSDLLRHLYVLLPVLDNNKHYWVDENEVEKLLRQGEGWLAQHPNRTLITRRYLSNFDRLTRLATGLLTESDAERPAQDDLSEGQDRFDRNADAAEATIEQPISLNDQRIDAVLGAVAEQRPSSVIDLGCGEGKLLEALAEDATIERLVGADVSISGLERAGRRLKLDQRPERQRPSVELWQSPLTYRDRRVEGFDVACLVEVIEHIDPVRLDAVEPLLFHYARPRAVIITTPNREYNTRFNLVDGALRHRDHRFEWTRAEFTSWCDRIEASYRYRPTIRAIGPIDPSVGPPTQMAVLIREDIDGR